MTFFLRRQQNSNFKTSGPTNSKLQVIPRTDKEKVETNLELTENVILQIQLTNYVALHFATVARAVDKSNKF